MNVLAEERAIARVLTEYCYLIDLDQVDRLIPEVFDPEATGDYGFGEMSAPEMVAMISRLHGNFEALGHFLSNVTVDVDPSGDRAKSKSYVTAWHWLKETSGKGRMRPAEFVAVGIYEDQFVRRGTAWRIIRRTTLPIGGVVGIGRMPDNVVGISGVKA